LRKRYSVGQQQLLLIVVGILLVGAAVIIGISLFHAQAIEQKRDYLMNEGMLLASMAQKYYLKPASINGGGSSYIGWTIPPNLETTASGTYKITDQATNSVTIVGTGNEVVTANDTIKIQIVVPSPPSDVHITVIN
jgi:hypothetical protein